MSRIPISLAVLALLVTGTARAADDTALRLANVSAANTAYVRIPNSAAFALQQFTVEAWVQRVGVGYGFSTDAVGGMIVGRTAEGAVGSYLGSWYLGWSNAGQAFFSVTHTLSTNGISIQGPAVVTPLGRHHLAAVAAADSVRLYVDGVLVASALWTLGTVYTGTHDMLIGASNFGAGYLRRFDGAIDDVRLWDHARKGSQIAALMNCRLTGNEPGLVAYYPFDASDLADATGHGHTGAAVATAGSLTFTGLASLSACITDAGPTGARAGLALSLAPSPTRGPAVVRFLLPRPGRVAIAVYDVAGRLETTLVAEDFEGGAHDRRIDLAGAELRPGIHFVSLRWNGERIVKPLVLLP